MSENNPPLPELFSTVTLRFKGPPHPEFRVVVVGLNATEDAFLGIRVRSDGTREPSGHWYHVSTLQPAGSRIFSDLETVALSQAEAMEFAKDYFNDGVRKELLNRIAAMDPMEAAYSVLNVAAFLPLSVQQPFRLNVLQKLRETRKVAAAEHDPK